jgi:hypothetical protein
MVASPDRDETSPAELATGGPPKNGHGNGHRRGHGTGSGGDGPGPGDPGRAEPQREPPVPFPARRRSVWPFLLDLGVVLALFGLIITGRFLIVIGAVIAVVALIGWIREARAEYSQLAD